MARIVSALIETSAYSAVVTGAILLFRAAFKRNISPKLQYLAWMLLIVRLALPVTVETGFHVESLLPLPEPAAQVADAGGETAAQGLHTAPDTQEAGPLVSAVPTDGAGARPAAPSVHRADPNAVIVAVWVCGMGAFAVWMAVVKARYFRRMRARSMDTPEAVTALYESCRTELGVKGRVRIRVVDAAISPGITLLIAPVIFLPAGILGSTEKTRFALLHELTHYKRGDHIMCALMNLLRMAYWFNPVVHFAFGELQCDMETACDARVIEAVGGARKREYLETVIELFSFETQPQLGMARLTARRMAERRMKGAFMKNKATAFSRLAAAALAVILIAGCFTTACQPAPADAVNPDSPDILAGDTANSPVAIVDGTAVITDAALLNAPALGDSVLRSSYTVTHNLRDGGDQASDINIQLAAQRINENGGITVQPGEEWSFSEALGPFAESNGWTLAPAVVSGGYAENSGCEGICYVSSALYCALLTGDITVTERAAHAWPIMDIEPGLDAAVSTGVTDLKFINNTALPLTIKCFVEKSEDGSSISVTADLWGEPVLNGTAYELTGSITGSIPLTQPEIYVDDPSLAKGLSRLIYDGREGRRVEVYRRALLADGTPSDPKLLYSQEYHGRPATIAQGTGKPHPIRSMTDAELRELAKRLMDHVYNSAELSFDEFNSRSATMLLALGVDCGGAMIESVGASYTIGVPMEPFELDGCYPYAAVILALDKNVAGMNIGSLEYDPNKDTISLQRSTVEEYYADVMDKPLTYYAGSAKLMEELLLAVARHKG